MLYPESPVRWEIPRSVLQLAALDLVGSGKVVLVFAWDKPHSLELAHINKEVDIGLFQKPKLLLYLTPVKAAVHC